MQMQKGICIEVKDNRSIFLTADGEFVLGTAVTETAVGEEGYFRPLASKKTTLWKPMWVPLIAVLAVLAIVFSVVVPSGEAFAYVQVQINPGVEIGLNEKCQVISMRELNADGHDVIAKLGEWENQPLDAVLQRIVDLSLTGSTEEMTITTVAGENRENVNLSIESMIMAISADALKNNVNVHLKKATKEQWRQSVKEDVPVGQSIKEYKSINHKNEPLLEKGKEEPKEEKQTKPKKDKSPKPKGTKKDLPASNPKTDNPSSEKPKEDNEPEKATPAVSDQIKANPPVPREKKVMPPGQNKKPQILPNETKQKIAPGQEKKKNEAPKAEQKEKPQAPGKAKQKEKPETPGKAKQEEKAKSPDKEKEPKKAVPPGQGKNKTNSTNGNGKPDKSEKEKNKSSQNE